MPWGCPVGRVFGEVGSVVCGVGGVFGVGFCGWGGSLGAEVAAPVEQVGAGPISVDWQPRVVGSVVSRDLSEFGLGSGSAGVVAVDPDVVGLKRLVWGLAPGDSFGVSLVDGWPARIVVSEVLVEREVADGPGPLSAPAEGWLPRFRDGDVTVIGRGVGADGSPRTFRLTTFGGLVSAQLWGPERVQALRAGRDGSHVVVDAAGFSPVLGEGDVSSGELAARRLVVSIASSGSVSSSRTVDVLVVTSKDADALAAGAGNNLDVTLRARDIVANMNSVSSNNGVDILFRFVGFFDLGEFLPSDPANGHVNANDLLDGLVSGTAPFDHVHDARNSANADIVIQLTGLLFTDADEPDIGGQAARVEDPAGIPESSYAVFKVNEPTTSAVHEVGHLFGARHDVFKDPTSTPFADGHGFVYEAFPSGQKYRTIMAYNDDPICPCSLVEYWSDPNAFPNGQLTPAGNTTISNVARVMSDGAPVVSAYEATTAQRLFRPSTGMWYIDGDDDGVWDDCTTDLCLGPYGSGMNPVLHPAGHLGYMNPNNGQWRFDTNDNRVDDGCVVDTCLGSFGGIGEDPFVLADGTIGTFHFGADHPDSGVWHFDDNGNGAWDGCVVDRCVSFGQQLDRPVLDPDGNIGVYRKTTGMWYLDTDGVDGWGGCLGAGGTDTCWGPFGADTDRPVVTADGQIGVFRPVTNQPGLWFFDLDNNHAWSGCAVDLCRGPMGASADLAVDAVGSFAPTP